MTNTWQYTQVSIKRQFLIFCVRWLVNSGGLWIAVLLLENRGVMFTGEFLSLLLGGLILSMMNTILRPIIVILALPAILLTLGLFMIIVNGLIVYIAAYMAPGFHIGFGGAILTGLIIALLNYGLSGVIELKRERKQQ